MILCIYIERENWNKGFLIHIEWVPSKIHLKKKEKQRTLKGLFYKCPKCPDVEL